MLPPAHEAGQSPAVCMSSLSLSLFLSLPFPPTALRLLPHVTLYLPFEQSPYMDSPEAPPTTDCPTSLTHTFVMPTGPK